VAWLGGQVVQQVLLPGYPWDAGVVDARVLALTLVIGVLTALGAGLAPAAQAWSTDLNDSLRTASPVTGGRTGLLRTGLLVAQVALCVVLLVGAGLFVRSLSAVLAHDVGMDLDRLVLASLPVLPAMTTAGADAQHAEAVARVGHLPGVARATVTRGSGPASISMGTSVLLEHWTLSDTNGRAMPQLYVVEPGYFETIGASIERGRGFSTEDAIPGTRVAVVNRAMQADFWPDADPIGECLRVGNKRPCTPVVGVVENVLAYSRVNVNTPQLYLLTAHPFADGRVPRALLMRLAAGAAPESVVPEIRRTLQSMSPDMPFVPVDMLEAVVAPQLQPWRLGSTMFLVFGGVALFIAAVGLYGALSHAVSQRSREIGIRIALGATRWHVVAQIARRGALTIAAGTLVGLLLAAYSTRWLTDLLYETSPRDPIVFVVVGLVLAAAGLAAAIVPARRSARVDPLVVLKTE
jgi:predicted permease